MVGINELGHATPPDLAHCCGDCRRLPAKFAAVVSLLPTWLTMRRGLKFMRRTFGVTPVEFSFSSSRTKRAERGVARARCAKNEENEEKIRREVQCSEGGSYGGGMIYLRSLWVEFCKSEELAGGRGGTRGAAGPGTNALYS